MGNEDDETPLEENLAGLINRASSNLASSNQRAKDYLVSLALEGELEQYQTIGSINRWASKLLNNLREGGIQNTAR